MTKRKVCGEELLKYSIIVRVNESLHQRLNKLIAESDCRTLAEVVCKVLTNQKVKCFYQDASMNAPMEEMALIRKELKSIGVNISQQTRY
ncbi:MAG: hypothetical protein EOP48_17635 [Sphingobacteriales bacterium]|nr:MAG: hypothetical protein EOP48_17635 [Sphingobacteriales bacterium]